MTNLKTHEGHSGWPSGHLAERLDAAQAHLLEDKPDEAIAIWRQLVSEGGEAADWGHIEIADYLFSKEQEDDARDEMRALISDRAQPGVPWLLAAGLLEDRGQLHEAHFWYCAAAAALPAPERTAAGERTFSEAWAHATSDDWWVEVRAGRRRTRWAIGIPLDDDDLLARMGYDEAREKVLGLNQLLNWPQVIDGTFQFRSRLQFDSLGGGRRTLSTPYDDRYYKRAERSLREHDSGRVLLLPRQDDVLLPLTQAAFRARSMFELVSVTSRCELGDAIEWPPGRNQTCWCESGTKYKKCCGGPLPAFQA
ncbi:SEC-C domain-containing protein [Kribbella sp. NBC_00382]|uniref:SEC-C domain-containing protein n=1 Tax=Kribbella sp. NBC_00382 TaxID=2975967 RepID=UPI002E1D27E0